MRRLSVKHTMTHTTTPSRCTLIRGVPRGTGASPCHEEGIHPTRVARSLFPAVFGRNSTSCQQAVLASYVSTTASGRWQELASISHKFEDLPAKGIMRKVTNIYPRKSHVPLPLYLRQAVHILIEIVWLQKIIRP